jgi:hypothetical protein
MDVERDRGVQDVVVVDPGQRGEVPLDGRSNGRHGAMIARIGPK